MCIICKNLKFFSSNLGIKFVAKSQHPFSGTSEKHSGLITYNAAFDVYPNLSDPGLCIKSNTCPFSSLITISLSSGGHIYELLLSFLHFSNSDILIILLNLYLLKYLHRLQ